LSDESEGETVIVQLPADLLDSLDRFIIEVCSQGTTRSEALRLSFRDWAIGHGYLELPPAREDMN
jgi:metal-responsive CopG/Arc/MetJ family transcriptional regulator